MSEIFGNIVQKDGKKLWILLDPETEDFKADNALLLGNTSVTIDVDDGTQMTAEQRKFAYAVMGEIYDAGIGGYNPFDEGGWLINKDTVKAHFKRVYMMRYGEEFSFKFGASTRQQAAHFIEILLEYVDEHDISIRDYSPLDYLSDVGRYTHCYRSIMNKRCAVCGRQGDFHHLEGSRIGSGNNRKKVNHLDRWGVELCRIHHNEAHGNEKKVFEKYHLIAVKVDELIAKKHNLNIIGGHDDRLREEYE